MKKRINIIALFHLLFFVASCSMINKSDNVSREQLSDDSPTDTISAIDIIESVDSSEFTDSIINEIIVDRIVADTVIGHWTIKATESSNDIIIKRHEWAYVDYSIFLTILYDGNTVLDNKEVRTKDVIGSEGEFMMCGRGISWVSDSALYLSFTCLLPDSDDGWYKLYQIQPNGTSCFFDINDIMGVDGFYVIANFLPMYFNEKAVNSTDYDLKRLYEDYCTQEVAEKLATGKIKIASDNTDFRYADGTTKIESLGSLVGYPSGLYLFMVEFKPNPEKEHITEILYMEVDGASNKISRIEKVQK
ncbi:MAG: hypothetical protein K2J74_00650 [Muribaculaceae bacterium]|nr:hypothetical protein [Muribaculaceae bacterium]